MAESRKKYFVFDEQTERLAKLAANAQTTDELARLCQRMYLADYIHLENMDLWLAKHALTAVFRMLKQYPALRRQIHYFGTMKGFVSRKDELFAFLYPNSDAECRWQIKEMTDEIAREEKRVFKEHGLAFAFYTGYGECQFCGIILDEDDFDEKEIVESLAKDEKLGFSPKGCGTMRSVVDHELGHLLDFWLGISNLGEFSSKMRTLSERYIERNLSAYAVQGGVNYYEVVAEGIAEYRNNPRPREIAQFVGYLLEKQYKWKLKEIEAESQGFNLFWGK